jgi:hypothetical protein
VCGGCSIVTVVVVDPWESSNQKNVDQEQVGGDQSGESIYRSKNCRWLGQSLETTIDKEHCGDSNYREPGETLDEVLPAL